MIASIKIRSVQEGDADAVVSFVDRWSLRSNLSAGAMLSKLVDSVFRQRPLGYLSDRWGQLAESEPSEIVGELLIRTDIIVKDDGRFEGHFLF